MYGTTKLASELFAAEYADSYGVPAIIDRCGVLTGPWQMARSIRASCSLGDEPLLRPALRYIGYGGSGKQVRDILHVDDLLALVERQLKVLPSAHGEIYNVGGGRSCLGFLARVDGIVPARNREDSRDPTGGRGSRGGHPGLPVKHRASQAGLRLGSVYTPESIITQIAQWVSSHAAELEAITG